MLFYANSSTKNHLIESQCIGSVSGHPFGPLFCIYTLSISVYGSVWISAILLQQRSNCTWRETKIEFVRVRVSGVSLLTSGFFFVRDDRLIKTHHINPSFFFFFHLLFLLLTTFLVSHYHRWNLTLLLLILCKIFVQFFANLITDDIRLKNLSLKSILFISNLLKRISQTNF